MGFSSAFLQRLPKVEKEPGYYDWSDYEKIVLLAKELGLRMQCVMAFHTCGEADGDDFVVKLPSWVIDVAKRIPGVFYEDEFGVVCTVGLDPAFRPFLMMS